MTGCCAVGCKNKSEDGFKLYRIPTGMRNEGRRKIWLRNINRDNFSSDQSKLCEVHFEKSQFEPLIPGKLKPNAVPTIFAHQLLPKPNRLLCKRATLISEEALPLIKSEHVDHSYCDNDAMQAAETPHEDITDIPLPASLSDDFKSLVNNLRPPTADEDIEVLKTYVDDMREKYFELETQKQTLVKNLSTFLNPDQLEYLNGNPCKNWSDDTIKKALQIESACGYSGYQILIEQGYPLPSYKTLFIRTYGTFRFPQAN